MHQEILQEYNVEIEMYRGHKIKIGDKHCTELRFKNDKNGFYIRLYEAFVIVKDQKTLSSIKPTYARVYSYQPIEETGVINLGDKFTIFDYDENMKAGTGHVLEIIQEPTE